MFQSILRRLQAEPGYRVLVITGFTLTHGPYKQKYLRRFLHEYPNRAGDVGADDIARFGKIYAANHFPLAWNHEDTVRRLGLSMGELSTLTKVVQLFYESSIAELDRIFGATLDAIRGRDLLDESLIAFTADHGEVLYRASAPFKWSHSMQLAPEVLGVPWIVRSNDPSVRHGAYDGVTRSIDVLPTLLGLSGIPVPEMSQIEGHDLSDALRGIGEAPSLEAYSHTTLLVRSVFEQMYEPATARDWATAKRFFPDESADHVWVALRNGDDFYKRRKLDGTTWKTERFDLANDPWAANSLAISGDAQEREAASRLEAYRVNLVRSHEGDRAAERKRRLPDEEEAAKLKGLGYIQ